MSFPRFISPYGAGVQFATPYGAGVYAPERMPRGRRRSRGLNGLGAVILPNAPNPRICPAWGCGGPIWGGPITFQSGGSSPTPAPGTTVTPNSPVPSSFPTNQLFIASDGSQWAFSTATGTWMNVGTPYNLSVASPPPPPSTSTPVNPAVGATFTDSLGNVWTYNGTQWAETTNAASPNAAAAMPPTTAAAIGATQTDAAGNVYTYNGSTWVLTTPASSSSVYSTSGILNLLTQDNLITGVPNWLVGVGAALAYSVVSGKFSKGRR